MSDDRRFIHLHGRGYSDDQIAKRLFPRMWALRFWAGVAVGVLLMCVVDLTDMHVCVGECDGAGYDIVTGPRK